MALTLGDLLAPAYIRGIFSRVAEPANQLSRFLGWNIGGKARMPLDAPVQAYTYDILDYDRRPAGMVLNGRPATTAPRKTVGFNTVVLAKSHERDSINLIDLIGTRPLGGPASVITRQGEAYVERMVKRMRQRQENLIELISASMFNGGKYYLTIQGDDLLPSLNSSGANFTVDMKLEPTFLNNYTGGFDNTTNAFQMGTGANMVTTAWSNPNATIVTDCTKVSQAFEQGYGRPLKTIFINSDVWTAVRNNLEVRQLAGSSSNPVASITDGQTNPDGTKSSWKVAQLIALPGVDWYIYDGGLIDTITGNFFRSLPANTASFMTEFDADCLELAEGVSDYKQYDHTPLEFATGFFSYSAERANPAVLDLFAGQKFAPAIRTPKVFAQSRVM